MSILRYRLYSIGQICLVKFGPNPHPFKIVTLVDGTQKKVSLPHPQFHLVWRKIKDDPRVKSDLGSGKKHKTYRVPGWLVIEIFGPGPDEQEAA